MDKKKLFRIVRGVILFIAFTDLVLAFEAYISHFQVLDSMFITKLPIVFGLISFFVNIFLAFKNDELSKLALKFMMVLSCVVGFVGCYFHNKWRFVYIYKAITTSVVFDYKVLLEYTPPLAPLAFCGVGLLGLYVLSILDSRSY